jgi:hypothetical protein
VTAIGYGLQVGLSLLPKEIIWNFLSGEPFGGGRGIRTPVTLSGKAVFKTACFNRSHIPPRECSQ